MTVRRAAVVVLMVSVTSVSAFAQEPATREQENRRQREEKSAEVKPYEPGSLERTVKFAEERAIFILDREGFYPKLGSLATGSGFAYGVGFRDRDLFANRGTLDLFAAASIKGYWATEARMTFPRLADNHLHLEAWASHRDYPQENYFGIGPDSNRADQSDYAIRTNRFGGRADIKPFARLLVGAGFEYPSATAWARPERWDPESSPSVQSGRRAGTDAVSGLPPIERPYRGGLSRASQRQERRMVSR